MSDDLRADVSAITWSHSIDLGHGIRTPGIDDSPLRLARIALPHSLAGLSVLDIGAWDGFFSFEAERRGAARVVAADSFSWGGGGWGSRAGFDLARRTLNSRVEDVTIDVMDLSPERVGQFDVVLFLGVLYHLRHPLLALERVASVSRGLVIVETVVDMLDVKRPAAAFYPDRELNNDPTNWWAPNLPALHGMVRAVGFPHVETVSAPPSSVWRRARALSRWVRGRSSSGLGVPQDRAVVHARK